MPVTRGSERGATPDRAGREGARPGTAPASPTFIWFSGAVLLALALVASFAQDGFFSISDSSHYLALAAGQPVMQPFASRPLAPLAARTLAGLLHISIQNGFILLGLLSLAVLAASVVWLLRVGQASRFTVVAVAGLCFWTQQFSGLVLPDLPFAALLAVLLVLLARRHTSTALLLLLPLAATRESTVLVLLCLLAAGWNRLRRRQLVAAAAHTAAGLLLAAQLSPHALPNREHLPAALYLFAKVPWNFVKNVFGIEPWANVYPACAEPRWSVPLHLGPLHAVGVCGFDSSLPLHLALWALASFGLLPLLLWRVRGAARSLYGGGDLLLRFTLLYGLVAYASAGLLGYSVWRLFSYAWPLFLVALPRVLAATGATFRSRTATGFFLAAHLALSWAVYALRDLPALLVAVVAWAAGVLLVRRHGHVPPDPASALSRSATMLY